ncbi:MAG: hypothetical protein KAR35_04675 [Candidatus Heimdallarchaeota archaeon]|nr:hypothetical protein [Candidatus Heimdallarchaeota archaeon]MCK5048650.1 hypothetical protein [Candidatus Heimdallarchaeota archaeon]
MRVHRLIFIISLILLSALLPLAISPADASFEAIPTTTTPPVIDGNVSDISEWLDSGNFTINFGGPHSIDANLYFTTNDTHMFILMNYTTEYYAPVNTTIPEPYNVTIENGSDPYDVLVTPTYNNQTHDWWAIVFDNNLDARDWKETNTPDDALTINRYFNESADARLYNDVSILNNTLDVLNKTLYNDTLLEDTNVLINGTNDVVSSMNYTTAVDSDLTTVTIELVKPLYSTDENGSDYDYDTTRAISFNVYFWENKTNHFANTSDLFAHSYSSDWLAYYAPLDEEVYLATQPINCSMSIDLRGVPAADKVHYNSFINSLLLYNYDIGQIGSDITLEALESANLTILIVNTHAYTGAEISAIHDYIRFGGQLMIIVGSKGQANADDLLDDLGISTVSSPVLATGENDIGLTKFTANLSNTLPFMNEATSFTNESTRTVTISNVTALNLTLMDEQTLFEQKYSYHSFLDVFPGLFVDQDSNGSYNSVEDMTLNANYSLGAVFEFYFGGRVSVFSSLDLFGSNFFDTDNLDLFYRMMQWNAKFIDETETQLKEVTPNVLKYNEEAYFEANVTFKDGLVFENAIVTVEIYRSGSLVDSFELTETDGIYSGYGVMNYTGAINVKVVAYQAGYGYSSSDSYPVLVEKLDHGKNTPSALMVIIALANIGIVILFGLRFAVFRKSE